MTARSKREQNDSGTRARLLETAGQIFADKGFDRATGKEICKQAGANVAAINYHFRDLQGLYAAVVWEAHSRLVTFDALSAAVSRLPNARAKLEAALTLFVQTITGPASSSWTLRVIAREFVSPSPALDAVREKEILPKSRILRSIVSELLNVPADDPAVARGCISIISPCIMLLILDRRTFKLIFPKFGLTAADSEALVAHLVKFSLAGLAEIKASRRKKGAR